MLVTYEYTIVPRFYEYILRKSTNSVAFSASLSVNVTVKLIQTALRRGGKQLRAFQCNK